MLQLFHNMGNMVRTLFGFGFAALWGYMAHMWYGMGEFGPGMPTVIGVGALAVVAGFGGLISLMRVISGTAAPAARSSRSAAWDDDQPSDFDADAVIARHLAKRQASRAAAPSADVPADPRPVRAAPAFGRKVV